MQTVVLLLVNVKLSLGVYAQADVCWCEMNPFSHLNPRLISLDIPSALPVPATPPPPRRTARVTKNRKKAACVRQRASPHEAIDLNLIQSNCCDQTLTEAPSSHSQIYLTKQGMHNFLPGLGEQGPLFTCLLIFGSLVGCRDRWRHEPSTRPHPRRMTRAEVDGSTVAADSASVGWVFFKGSLARL